MTYRIVEHDGGYAYKLGDVFSESFPNHASALRAAQKVAREQQIGGDNAEISFQDASGEWHVEHVDGGDRPETKVVDD